MTPLLHFVLIAMSQLDPSGDHLEIANAIASVVASEPPLFAEDAARHKTASLVVAVGFRESNLRNDVVSKTDDWCFLQIHRRPDLAADVEECARVGLAMLRASFRACPRFPIATYAEGPRGCASPRAQRISRDRIALATRVHRAAEAVLASEVPS